MFNCAEIVAMLSDYLDRDLPADTCTVIQNHLEMCPDCREAAENLRKMVSLCRQYATDNRPRPLPADKEQELRAAFERVMAHMRRRD
jgi:predicted anti-sigma-YlaC factor YlaD